VVRGELGTDRLQLLLLKYCLEDFSFVNLYHAKIITFYI
jgi:hypothetical protein